MINFIPPSLLSVVVLLFLFFISIIDFKHKAVPSIFTTGLIFGLFYFNPQTLYYAVGLGIFGLFLWEAEEGGIGGVADIKALIIIGLILNNLIGILYIGLLVFILGLAYKFIAKYVFKIKKEVPYLIVFAVSLLVLMIVNSIYNLHLII